MEIKNKTENMKIQRMVTNQEEKMVTPSACLQQVALQKHREQRGTEGNQEAHPSDMETFSRNAHQHLKWPKTKLKK